MKRQIVELFLLRIEKNEQFTFKYRPDDLIFSIIPFFQLIYVTNIEILIKELISLDNKFDCRMVRVEGYLAIAIAEQNYQEEEFQRNVIRILKMIRF